MSERHDLRLMPGSRVPLREATPFGQAPKYLICDHDSKCGSRFLAHRLTEADKIIGIPNLGRVTPRLSKCRLKAEGLAQRQMEGARTEHHHGLDHLMVCIFCFWEPSKL